jgi:hypothetical protein
MHSQNEIVEGIWAREIGDAGVEAVVSRVGVDGGVKLPEVLQAR